MSNEHPGPPSDGLRMWYVSFCNESVAEYKARAVEYLVAAGLHPVRARRLAKDTALIAAAEGGPELVAHRLGDLVYRETGKHWK